MDFLGVFAWDKGNYFIVSTPKQRLNEWPLIRIDKMELEGLRNTRPKNKKHLIKDMRWYDNFISCKCGWEGKIEEFSVHSKE